MNSNMECIRYVKVYWEKKLGVSGQSQKYLKNPKAERVRGISHQA